MSMTTRLIDPTVCNRCLQGRRDAPGIRWRRLFRLPGLVAALCDECNGTVQGPDHLDIETENQP